MQPEHSTVIMYKGESVAKTIDELAEVLNDKNYEALKNEMLLFYKSKQA